MACLKHGGRLKEATVDGTTQSFIYSGTYEEMYELHSLSEIGEYNVEAEGKLTSKRLNQEEGPVWNCELIYSTSKNGDYSTSPDYSYGSKSASLRGSLLSLDLSMAAGYRTNWNYALYCAPGHSKPSWWASAKTTELSDANAQNYLWAKVGEEHSDARGKWKCIPPTKPGVESIDYATYSITESARYANRNQAGKMCAKKLNKIGTPSEDFGLGGSWKCDDATVSWTGEYWLATLTWTRAGGSSGWDKDLYE